MPEPSLRLLFSRGGASLKKRLKNSSRGSLEPERGARCEEVEMFTTTGMVFFAMAAKDGGRPASRAPRLAAAASDGGASKRPRQSASTGRAPRTAPLPPGCFTRLTLANFPAGFKRARGAEIGAQHRRLLEGIFPAAKNEIRRW